jgi:hypothetical protein
MNIGRVGGLAVGLGIGAAPASVPWMAAANPSSDLTDLLLGPGPVVPSGLDSLLNLF